MKIAIGGGGEIGCYLCQKFCTFRHDVMVLDHSQDVIDHLQNEYNAQFFAGDIRDATFLKHTPVGICDFYLAVSDDQSGNILSASIAKSIGAHHVMARADAFVENIHQDTQSFNYRQHFGIDTIIDPSAICAMEFAKIIRNPGRVAVESIADGQIEVQRFVAKTSSRLIGQSLKWLHIPSDVRIITLLHEGIEIIPSSDTIISENDIVTIAGERQSLTRFLSKVNLKEINEETFITIYGATSIADSLIDFLKSKKYHLRVIDESRKLCEKLFHKHPHVTVICGDPSSIALWQEEQIGLSDYFISASADDEKNTMVAIQAKNLGVSHVMLALNYGNYETVLAHIQSTLGIDKIVSKRIATADVIAQSVSEHSYRVIDGMSDKNNTFIDFYIGPHCRLIGKKIKNLGLPKSCILIAIIHKFSAKIPSADDVIALGDRIVAAVRTKDQKTFLKLFSIE